MLAHAVVDRVLHDEQRRDRRGGREDADDRRAPRRAAAARAGSGRAGRGRCWAYAATTSSPKSAAERRRPRRAAPRRCRPRRSTPSSSTTARSATSTVESRCAAISTVRPASAGRRPVDEVPLGLRVDRRHRVVEHDHARAGDERAGERDALALAAREVDAALADQRVVAVGQLVRRTARRRPRRRRRAPRPTARRAARRSGCRAAGSRRGSGRCVTIATAARSSLERHVADVDAADQHASRRSGRRSAAAG